MPGYITIAKVREEMQDRGPADNSIDCDYAFTDEEIMHAMERAAASYNALAPIGIGAVSAKAMPDHMSFLMDAVVCQLLKSAIHKLSRNLMTWQTGDTNIELEKSRMTAYQAIRQELEQSWKQEAKEWKMEINRSLCWGAM